MIIIGAGSYIWAEVISSVEFLVDTVFAGKNLGK